MADLETPAVGDGRGSTSPTAGHHVDTLEARGYQLHHVLNAVAAERWVASRGGVATAHLGLSPCLHLETAGGRRIADLGDWVVKFMGRWDVLRPGQYRQLLDGGAR